MTRVWDRYRQLGVLGRGGMGEVLHVVDEGTGAEYALKRLLFEDEGSRLRFQREAEAVARLDHPNVLRIHRAEFGSPSYLLTEFLSGGSLEERLEGGALSNDEAREVVRGVGEGVAHAHGRGVLHRDLKPENVLFDERGVPKVADFGLARRDHPDELVLTETGTIMGTPAYMPPEQAFDPRNVDERADVYGLGAILYACLTGRPPIDPPDPSPMVVLASVIEQRPRPPRETHPRVDPRLEAVCLKALEKEPEARYPTARALLRALDPSVRRAERARARRRRLWAGGVCGVGVAVGLGVWTGEGAERVERERPERRAEIAPRRAPLLEVAGEDVEEGVWVRLEHGSEEVVGRWVGGAAWTLSGDGVLRRWEVPYGEAHVEGSLGERGRWLVLEVEGGVTVAGLDGVLWWRREGGPWRELARGVGVSGAVWDRGRLWWTSGSRLLRWEPGGEVEEVWRVAGRNLSGLDRSEGGDVLALCAGNGGGPGEPARVWTLRLSAEGERVEGSESAFSMPFTGPRVVRFSPGGGPLVVGDGDGGLWRIDHASGELQRGERSTLPLEGGEGELTELTDRPVRFAEFEGEGGRLWVVWCDEGWPAEARAFEVLALDAVSFEVLGRWRLPEEPSSFDVEGGRVLVCGANGLAWVLDARRALAGE